MTGTKLPALLRSAKNFSPAAAAGESGGDAHFLSADLAGEVDRVEVPGPRATTGV
jgi:hypothetical protein